MARLSWRSHLAWPGCLSRTVWRSTAASLVLMGFVAPAARAQAAHQHAHVHGAARIGVVVQGETVSITLESPLESLIGFEHRPKTPAQQSAATALQTRMRDGTDLFRFDAAAACSLIKADARSAIFEPAPAGAAAETHNDLDAGFEFRCASPERLTQLDIGLFAAYPRLQRLEVEVATDKGQFKRGLKRPARIVALKR
jgi:hypothetical protein